MRRKLFCLFLSIILVISAIPPVSALENAEAENNVSLQIAPEMTLVGEDLPNGDARISITQNGIITFTSYINRATHKITDTDHTTGSVSTRYFTPATSTATSIQPFASGYFHTEGYLTFDWYHHNYTTPSGTRRIRVESKKTLNIINNYDLYGTYQNLATFASVLVGGLSVSAAYGVNILAPKLLAWLGIGTIVAPIVIGHKYVTMRKTTLSWRFSDYDVSSFNQTLTGYQYQYSLDGNTHTDTEGTWFPENSYSSHNTTFAYRAYTTLWGTDTQGVLKSWSL